VVAHSGGQRIAAHPRTVGPVRYCSLATSSTRIMMPDFLRQMASLDAASNISTVPV
jgi:hypothetical protein